MSRHLSDALDCHVRYRGPFATRIVAFESRECILQACADGAVFGHCVFLDMAPKSPHKKKDGGNRETVRERIVAMHRSGKSPIFIAKTQRCSVRTVNRTIARYTNGEALSDRKRTGRPSALTRYQVKSVESLMKDKRFGSLRTARAELARRGTVVCFKTLANHLQTGHLRARHRTTKFAVSAANQRKRVQWAVDHLDDSMKRIRKRAYSDEKVFVMNPTSRWGWVDDRDPHPVVYKSTYLFCCMNKCVLGRF